MHWGLPPDSCVAQRCVSDLPVLYFVRPPTQYLSCCFSMAADASSRVPLPPHPSLTHTFTSNHTAVKGFLRNLGQLSSSLVSLNHLGLPLLADESLNHCSLNAEAPHFPTVASPMSLWGPCLGIPPLPPTFALVPPACCLFPSSSHGYHLLMPHSGLTSAVSSRSL